MLSLISVERPYIDPDRIERQASGELTFLSFSPAINRSNNINRSYRISPRRGNRRKLTFGLVRPARISSTAQERVGSLLAISLQRFRKTTI
jgi:hypothetical protein